VTIPTRAACAELDRADPLAPLRAQFDLPDGVIYLDGNSLGALPAATAARLRDAVVKDWGQGLIRSWNDAHWIDLPHQVGNKIARLIGAKQGDVVACDSTSVNLFKVVAAALSIQRATKPARKVIVSERGNFPTDLYVAEGVCAMLGDVGGGYALKLVDGIDELNAAIASEPAVVMLTHVDYRSGAMHDMASVTAAAHSHGALVIWDLAHSAGAMPLSLDACDADFAVGCGYKYLNGGPGAPAFIWVAARHQAQASQPLSGWFGHAAPFRFESGYRAAPGISRYLSGTPQVLGMLALDAGVNTLLAAESHGGLAALRDKSAALCDLFITLSEAGPAQHLLTLVSPRDRRRRGSQVSFFADSRELDGYALMQALIGQGVIGDFRDPGLLRFGMAPAYLRYVDIYDAVVILNDIVASRKFEDARFAVRADVT
jgi:kynureninase